MRRFRWTSILGILLLCAMVGLCTQGCSKKSKDNAGTLGASTGDPSGTGIPSGSGGGSGGFSFEPPSVNTFANYRVDFQLAGGTPPYEVGFNDVSDVPSYAGGQPMGTFDSDTGGGSYYAGPYGGCTDTLRARDSAGLTCYMKIHISDYTPGTSGGGSGGSSGGGSSGGGSGGVLCPFVIGNP